MSRRKQTNPFKVNWPFPPGELSGTEHNIVMDNRQNFTEDSEGHSSNSNEVEEQDSITGSFPSTELAGTEHSIMMANRANFTEDSESHSNNSHEAEEQDIADDSESDIPGEDTSSDTSVDDALMSPKTIQSTADDGYVKQEIDDGDQLNAGYFCPLCHVECGSPEQLIAHVYKHTSVVGTRKSYVCPVCGRALSSPGSLGRHLLIHSEDRLSNCAVCGARFTVRCTFSREKVQDFLNSGESVDSSSQRLLSISQTFPVDLNLCPNQTPPIPQLSDVLNSPTSSLYCLSDVLNPTPVYPAGILLVCNRCVVYQQLVDAQSPSMRKWAIRRQNEPLEARMQRLERERMAKKSKRASESPAEREQRRMRDREAKRMQRMQETEEQRARRLQRDREAMRLKRANETPEKRQARLIREREAKRLKRRLEKIDPTLRTQIEHDPAAVAALTADMNLFQFPMPCPNLENGLFMKLPLQE
uniref:Zinc finger protein 821 n=2 Tax=Erpetoichthys calabaricus TaxID=27687 RepID=A0A8C4XAY0_ERPCA